MVLSVSGDEKFTLSAAKRNERNILARLRRRHATEYLYQDLWHKRGTISAITAHHLGKVDPSACIVQGIDNWKKGQFNICIIIQVHDSAGSFAKKMFRCPMPHKFGEQYSPGAVDEKIRAEVATYAWIEKNCPEIPIPCLHAFGLSSDLQFTHNKSGVGYSRDASNHRFDYPYMLLDYIESESGTMLSDTLHEFREADQTRLQNLCHGISQIMLSLASKPQSHIGSLRFNDDGSIILANRPLFCTNSLLESEGMARTVDKTYATTGDFVDDMLRFREEVFRAQPNAVNDEDDCRLQMLHLTFLQRWKRQLVDCDFGGPFVLQLTDFHASNIFVDDQWNIVALIDLEFVCALPPSMMYVPHWLSVDAIDEIGGYMPAFEKMHKTFMDIFQKEEGHKAGSLEHENKTRLASLIQNSWEDYSYWFYLSLTSIDLIPYCVEDHLYKKFDVKLSTDEEKQLAKQTSSAWPPGFVEQKVRDKAKYDQDVVHHFNTQHVSTTKLSADDNMM